jgi:DNA adenine methylase
MRSFLNYMGGKSRLARAVAERLPACRCYVEVFGGAAWVLFAREPSYVEVLNDVNGRLVNLYRVVRDAPDELAEALELLPRSRSLYREFRESGVPDDPVAAAAIYYYLIKNAFSGQVGCGFSSSKRFPGKYSMLADFKLWARRLNKVTIENLGYADCLRRYDSAETAFYVDPPYVGTERYYGGDFAPDDHERLRDVLARLKGRWLASYNDCPTVRALYGDYNIEEVRPRYCADKVGPRGRRRAAGRELFITNFRIRY